MFPHQAPPGGPHFRPANRGVRPPPGGPPPRFFFGDSPPIFNPFFLQFYSGAPINPTLMEENVEFFEQVMRYVPPHDFLSFNPHQAYQPFSPNDGSEISAMHTLESFGVESAAPKGSRLAKYMGASSSRPGSSTSTMNANVPSFVPQFAKMNLTENHANTPAPFVPRSFNNGLNGYNQDISSKPYQHEMQGGTMYFYQHDNAGGNGPNNGEGESNEHTYVNTNGSFTYQGPVPHIGKFRPKSNMNGVSQFVAPEIKLELLNRQLAMESRADPAHYPDLPQQVEHLNNFVPLENTLSHNTQTVYRAHSVRDGVPYCVRRLHNYRLQHTENLKNVEKWKKLSHINIVQLKEVVAHTRNFGDNSLLFIYEYYPLADTMKTRHFGRMQGSAFVDGITGAKISNPHPTPQLGAGVSESILWSYIIQISAALRVVHASGMSFRSLDLSKILIFGKNKILLGCAGMPDLLTPQSDANLIKNQLQDCVALGEILLQLATGNLFAAKREVVNQSYAYVNSHYSLDMNNLISHAPTTPQFPRRGINEVMPMIGARFYTQLENMQMKSDGLENELSKELENGRLFRLLSKLNTIVERAENHIDPSWSETGDRFLLKLFRDYVFHQVMENGKPWLDMAHVVQCLNKLDAGVPEKIELVSRDGENLIIVSYGDLKRCIETAFRDLVATPSVVARH